MMSARNLLAVYSTKHSPEQLAQIGYTLAALSSYRVLPRQRGWLVAVDGRGSARDVDSDDLTIFEADGAFLGRWGAAQPRIDELRRLPGEFGFCWFGEGGSALAVRSCGGLVPLYYYVDPRIICVATRLRDLYWVCPSPLKADELVHAIWSSGNAIFPEGRTLLRDVRIVEKGEALLLRPGCARATRYWDPRPQRLASPDEETERAHAAELRSTLVETLEARLTPRHTNLLTLSGGVDSSSLAVLIARVVRRPLATVTFVAPHSSRARARQLHYVTALLQELGLGQRFFFDAENSFLDRLFETELTTLFYCPHPALRILPQLTPSDIGTIVSGHFADEICGYSQRRQDWVRHTTLVELLTPRVPPRYGLTDGLRWAKRRVLERMGRALLPLASGLDDCFHPRVREEFAAWGHEARRRMLADPRPLRELAAWVELDGWIALHWEIASRHGATPVNPFFTRRALELAFQCHPVELFGPGTKKILRRALAGVVPEQYLHRRDKGHWYRPPRRELGPWSGTLSVLSTCVAPELLDARRTALTVSQRRYLTQLMLFEAALTREEATRRKILGETS